jgi:hypothetical protein
VVKRITCTAAHGQIDCSGKTGNKVDAVNMMTAATKAM